MPTPPLNQEFCLLWSLFSASMEGCMLSPGLWSPTLSPLPPATLLGRNPGCRQDVSINYGYHFIGISLEVDRVAKRLHVVLQAEDPLSLSTQMNMLHDSCISVQAS